MPYGTPWLSQSGLEKYTLSRNISAIQVTSSIDGRAQLGTIMQLPEGAQLDVCGDGFNDRTVKVRWEGTFYFIFRQDIESNAAEQRRHAHV